MSKKISEFDAITEEELQNSINGINKVEIGAAYIRTSDSKNIKIDLNKYFYTKGEIDAKLTALTPDEVSFTAGSVLITSDSGKILSSDTAYTTLKSHLNNKNIHISTEDRLKWDNKQNAITGAASTITSKNLTANRVLVSNADGKVSAGKFGLTAIEDHMNNSTIHVTQEEKDLWNNNSIQTLDYTRGKTIMWRTIYDTGGNSGFRPRWINLREVTAENNFRIRKKTPLGTHRSQVHDGGKWSKGNDLGIIGFYGDKYSSLRSNVNLLNHEVIIPPVSDDEYYMYYITFFEAGGSMNGETTSIHMKNPSFDTANPDKWFYIGTFQKADCGTSKQYVIQPGTSLKIACWFNDTIDCYITAFPVIKNKL